MLVAPASSPKPLTPTQEESLLQLAARARADGQFWRAHTLAEQAYAGRRQLSALRWKLAVPSSPRLAPRWTRWTRPGTASGRCGPPLSLPIGLLAGALAREVDGLVGVGADERVEGAGHAAVEAKHQRRVKAALRPVACTCAACAQYLAYHDHMRTVRRIQQLAQALRPR